MFYSKIGPPTSHSPPAIILRNVFHLLTSIFPLTALVLPYGTCSNGNFLPYSWFTGMTKWLIPEWLIPEVSAEESWAQGSAQQFAAGTDTNVTLAQTFPGGDEAADNGADCVSGTTLCRAALAPLTWPLLSRPMWTAPLCRPCRATVNVDTYVWCTSGSQGPYSSRGSTGLHTHWPWNKARLLSPAAAALSSRVPKLPGGSCKPSHLPPYS